MRDGLVKNPLFGFSITCTTRKPRTGEIDGKDYYFVSKDVFSKMLKEEKLLEWAEVHGNYYGTPVKSLHDVMQVGKIPVMTIDVKGAASVKKIFTDAVTIFILPPTAAILKKRLEMRGEKPENIAIRLDTAKKEMKQAHLFDYLVVNNKLDIAISEIVKIAEAQTLRMMYKKDFAANFAKDL